MLDPTYKAIAQAVTIIAAVLSWGPLSKAPVNITTTIQTPTEVTQDTPTTPPPQQETIKLRQELYPICGCESTGSAEGTPRQFDENGKIITGYPNPKDRGMCQINQDYWLDEANALGYDIETEEGNIKMANYIYDQHGTEPWKYSRECWNKAPK